MGDKHEHHTSDDVAEASHHDARHTGDHTDGAHGTHPPHHTRGSHDVHAGHSVAMFRDKFLVSLLLTIPTLVWGHMLQRAFGYTAPRGRRTASWNPGRAGFCYQPRGA